jgi:hypothetical protein
MELARAWTLAVLPQTGWEEREWWRTGWRYVPYTVWSWLWSGYPMLQIRTMEVNREERG